MKKKLSVIFVIFVFILIVAIGYPVVSSQMLFYVPSNDISAQDAKAAFDHLNQTLEGGRFSYFEYVDFSSDLKYTDTKYTAYMETDSDLLIGYNDKAEFTVQIEDAGYYHLSLTYEMSGNVLSNGTISVAINGEIPFYEAATVDLPLYWYDESKDFLLDSYGDESLPAQIRVDGFVETPLYNNLYYTVDPLLFYFKQGENSITIKNVSSGAFHVRQLLVYSPKESIPYSLYKQNLPAKENLDIITVNATDYIEKNSSYIRLYSHSSPTVNPQHPVDKKLNIIASESWYEPGKSISYEVDVQNAGVYHLAIHHQSPKQDYVSFRSVSINGNIPFEEMKAYPLKNTKRNDFLYETLSDENGEPYKFLMKSGKNIITLRAEYEPISYEVRMIQLMIDHINQFSLDIRKITGREVDRKRTWRITEFLPETKQYLESYDILIKYIIQQTSVFAPNGAASSSLSFLQRALLKLDKMLENPDRLPLYFEDLYTGSGSVNQLLGDTMQMLTEQPIGLNEITLHTGNFSPRDNASWFQNIRSGSIRFIASFTSDKYIVRQDDTALNVWVNRPITHVDTLQKMVDADFSPNKGIKVKISVMPDANKLVLASAANDSPDIAMGLLSYMPFDLAIRNAAYDLTRFEDFWEVANRFTPGAFVPYVLEDGVYALPETLEFFAIVYRTDIFENLGLDVPDTWTEVMELLPELQRYGMNFYHPIAGGGSIKWFYQTSPFIYQYGGTLYSEDGLRSNIDTEASVAGISFLTRLFTMYSLPEQEPLFFNAFRYGTLPIGIADFNTYLQIKNAAPELVGKWSLANYPAMTDNDGNVNRWYIANGRGSLVSADTKKPEESWEFLKWWTDDAVQTNYGYTLQSIYGPEYLWLSGNLRSVENSPIDMADKLVILDQIPWLRDVPRTPSQYMLERGLSDIWNRVVYDGVPTRIAIDRQVITINRETRRKMIEFGYLNEAGEITRPYIIRDIDWIAGQMDLAGGE